MQAYPAYTIQKIEDELSWRIVREMLKCWEGRRPEFMTTERIEQILMKANNVIEIKKGQKINQVSDSALLSKFIEKGWLS